MRMGESAKKMTFFKSNPAWYYYEDEDDDDAIPLLTDKAPPEAVESYEFWKKEYEEHLRTGVLK